MIFRSNTTYAKAGFACCYDWHFISIIIVILFQVLHRITIMFHHEKNYLMLCMRVKNFNRWHFKIFFLTFPRKWVLIFHANGLGDHLHEISKPIFLEKWEKSSICCLLNLSIASSVLTCGVPAKESLDHLCVYAIRSKPLQLHVLFTYWHCKI